MVWGVVDILAADVGRLLVSAVVYLVVAPQFFLARIVACRKVYAQPVGCFGQFVAEIRLYVPRQVVAPAVAACLGAVEDMCEAFVAAVRIYCVEDFGSDAFLLLIESSRQCGS